ncbi:MAG TPA: hypothetical protein VEB42_12210 [Chitinophagaceae bacterium]|nr:hypothetical protein [Chitinophagaceae bacterium]
MRKSILAPIAIVICLSLKAQDYKTDVKTQFMQYMNLIMQKKFDKAMDYINPALFKIIPKEQFEQAMEAAFNNPSMEVSVEKAEIASTSDKQVISGVSYVKIKYVSYARLRMILEKGQHLDTAVLIQALEKSFGKGNVTYDKATNYFKMKKTENAVANSTDNKKWTFLVLAEGQKSMLEKILPKELL